MIKINLSNAQKQVDISNVGGFDLTKLKFKAVALAILLIYIPDFVFVPMWEEDYTTRNNDLNQIQDELRNLKKKVSKSKVLEEQIRNLNAQEITLGKKLLAVKQAISEKSNPTNLLLYIAKNIPSDLWLRELSIENDKMIIKGDSLSYPSVGTFTDNLRSSIFVKDASIKETTSKVRDSDKKRIEAFEIHFAITRLE